MDQQELAITFFGSFLIAFFAALTVVGIEKWWTSKREFQNSIKGLFNEIEINKSRLEELKETVSANLSNFEETKKIGGVRTLPPLILLHESFDYCRIKGIFSDLSDYQRLNIDNLYILSEMITILVDRDFQLLTSLFDHPEQLCENKKRTWEAILGQIEAYNQSSQKINFQNVIE